MPLGGSPSSRPCLGGWGPRRFGRSHLVLEPRRCLHTSWWICWPVRLRPRAAFFLVLLSPGEAVGGESFLGRRCNGVQHLLSGQCRKGCSIFQDPWRVAEILVWSLEGFLRRCWGGRWVLAWSMQSDWGGCSPDLQGRRWFPRWLHLCAEVGPWRNRGLWLECCLVL